MQKKAQEILNKFIGHDTGVVLGLSGGPDSVYLLHLLLRLRAKKNFRIIAAHVNHGLRGAASDLDETFVRDLAERHGLLPETASLPKTGKGNLEERARAFRYRFFEKIRKKHGAELILTAHHRDDSIETALFNLARGSYLKGVKGMETRTEEKHLLRPLLSVPKKEILAYLKRRRIKFRDDASNRDLSFSRNRIRRRIVPEFRKVNPAFDANFLNFMASLAETSALMEDMSGAWIRAADPIAKGIPLKSFLELPIVMRKNILASLYRTTHGDTRNFNRRHLEQVLSVLEKGRAGLKKEFGGGRTIEIRKSPAGERVIRVVRAPGRGA